MSPSLKTPLECSEYVVKYTEKLANKVLEIHPELYELVSDVADFTITHTTLTVCFKPDYKPVTTTRLERIIRRRFTNELFSELIKQLYDVSDLIPLFIEEIISLDLHFAIIDAYVESKPEIVIKLLYEMCSFFEIPHTTLTYLLKFIETYSIDKREYIGYLQLVAYYVATYGYLPDDIVINPEKYLHHLPPHLSTYVIKNLHLFTLLRLTYHMTVETIKYTYAFGLISNDNDLINTLLQFTLPDSHTIKFYYLLHEYDLINDSQLRTLITLHNLIPKTIIEITKKPEIVKEIRSIIEDEKRILIQRIPRVIIERLGIRLDKPLTFRQFHFLLLTQCLNLSEIQKQLLDYVIYFTYKRLRYFSVTKVTSTKPPKLEYYYPFRRIFPHTVYSQLSYNIYDKLIKISTSPSI